jgi:phosphoserine phosphatase
MSWVLSLVAASPSGLESGMLAAVATALAEQGGRASEPDWLAPGIACDIPFAAAAPYPSRLMAMLRAKFADAALDLAVQPAAGRRKRLLFADMESTVIGQELLDEMGRRCGLGERIARITERAMRGEIDYAQSLRERVALFAGRALVEIVRTAEVISPNPGARRMVRTMRAHGAHTVLVSGGFDIFARLVREDCGFDAEVANRLVVADGRLTGEVHEPILDRAGKAAVVARVAGAHGLVPEAALAVGDGANDIAMLTVAGLGVAYRAKATVKAAVPCHLDHADLSALLFFQGYRADELRD